MGVMASQITSLTIVYSTVYSRRRSKTTSKLCVTGLCGGKSPVTGEFPSQRASNAEKASMWWRHHGNSFDRNLTTNPIISHCCKIPSCHERRTALEDHILMQLHCAFSTVYVFHWICRSGYTCLFSIYHLRSYYRNGEGVRVTALVFAGDVEACLHERLHWMILTTSPFQQWKQPQSTRAYICMMTSSNGNIFRVTGLLCREFTGHWWIPRTKASDAELWCFLWPAPE